jgi:hypothetical protein
VLGDPQPDPRDSAGGDGLQGLDVTSIVRIIGIESSTEARVMWSSEKGMHFDENGDGRPLHQPAT